MGPLSWVAASIVAAEEAASDGELPVAPTAVGEVLQPGHDILIDDGLVRLRVEAVEGGRARCTVLTGGVVETHKGVNVPGVPVPIPSLTRKDMDDLWKTTENAWEYEKAMAQTGIWDSFQEGVRELHPSQYVSFFRMTEVMVKQNMVAYFLDRLAFFEKNGRWPTAAELPIPEDPWTKKPMLSVSRATGSPDGEKLTLWSVGPDRKDNLGADVVNGGVLESLEMSPAS